MKIIYSYGKRSFLSFVHKKSFSNEKNKSSKFLNFIKFFGKGGGAGRRNPYNVGSSYAAFSLVFA